MISEKEGPKGLTTVFFLTCCHALRYSLVVVVPVIFALVLTPLGSFNSLINFAVYSSNPLTLRVPAKIFLESSVLPK